MAAVPSIGRATGVEPRPVPAREATATHALYERYSRQIYNYCLHQLSSREEAEDAVQTTFMNAFRGFQRGIVPEAEQAWLFKIAENVCLSRRRSSWRRGRIESPNDFEVLQEIVPSRTHNRADELIGLEKALEAMPENQRRAILLREWQGFSYREIADELEITQAAVETLIFRARRSLAQGLEQPPEPKRKRGLLRGGLHGVNLGGMVAGLKSLLTGGAAVKAVAVAVAAGTATFAAAEAPKLGHHAPRAKPAATTHGPKGAHAPSVSVLPNRRSSAKASRRTFERPVRVQVRRIPAPAGGAPAAPPPAPSDEPATPAPTEPAAETPSTPASTPAVEPKRDDAPKVETPAAAPSDNGKGDGAPARTPAVSNGNQGEQGNGHGNGNEKPAEVAPAAADPAAAPAPAPPTNGTAGGNGNGNGGGNGNGNAVGNGNGEDGGNGQGKGK